MALEYLFEGGCSLCMSPFKWAVTLSVRPFLQLLKCWIFAGCMYVVYKQIQIPDQKDSGTYVDRLLLVIPGVYCGVLLWLWLWLWCSFVWWVESWMQWYCCKWSIAPGNNFLVATLNLTLVGKTVKAFVCTNNIMLYFIQKVIYCRMQWDRPHQIICILLKGVTNYPEN